MTDFKIGDEVEIISKNRCGGLCHDLPLGSIVKIDKIVRNFGSHEQHIYHIKGERWYATKNEIELVTPREVSLVFNKLKEEVENEI